MMMKIALGLMLVAFIVAGDNMPADANTPDKYAEFARVQFNKSFTGCKFVPVMSRRQP
ncbi:MAG TPA: hypothetical protein PKO22_12445 [Treponemataceae bacterium]|nr:hypothetical protein [Treponemataceae bacterium]